MKLLELWNMKLWNYWQVQAVLYQCAHAFYCLVIRQYFLRSYNFPEIRILQSTAIISFRLCENKFSIQSVTSQLCVISDIEPHCQIHTEE